MFYPFLLNMWVAKKIDAKYLDAQVMYGRIAPDEKELILSTPQIH